ncbi:hypothetical protein [Streptomyces sp. N35]|uniref:hypothetical protein n=1 Tax=Streptomyces sp. N35 TaxID=2795730 RepID=UPI0018F681D2|nr:hypothetical protein [Streptomyces sp. N35]
MNMNTPAAARHRALAVTALVLLGTLATACSSKPDGPSEDEQITKAATRYMQAITIAPTDEKTLCDLDASVHRDGTLKDCIAAGKARLEEKREDDKRNGTTTETRPADKVTISHVQDVPASDEHPAGKGLLATLVSPHGGDQNRYALRLIKQDDGAWRVQQWTDDRAKPQDTRALSPPLLPSPPSPRPPPPPGGERGGPTLKPGDLPCAESPHLAFLDCPAPSNSPTIPAPTTMEPVRVCSGAPNCRAYGP